MVGETELLRIDLTNASDKELSFLLGFEKDYWVNTKSDNILFSLLPKHKKTIPVDEQLLEDMKHWREQLLRNIKVNSRFNNYDFDDEDEFMHIEEEVQKIIDRLIFICYCEDKELYERKLKLLMIDKKERFELKPGYLWSKIQELFSEYCRIYNSDLFDKSDCDRLKIDDTIFLEILQDLREPKGRIAYNFRSIEADILGKAYENFIGHIQKGKKRFTEQEDLGKRKKEGIYYTPKYIVDYIVNNTVREYIKGKSFEEINKVKILDPACGSGSFLLRAFDVLVEESETVLKRELSYEEKKNLMLNCIYGVDLDKRAGDIAKLNLSLKLAWKEKLPLLRENIRQGNSLIDDKDIAGYNAFKWEDEFKEIIASGGFDVIVGNPPYVFARELLTVQEKDYFNDKYDTIWEKPNTYMIFMERSYNLISEGGLLSFIVPNSWLTVEAGKLLRKKIKFNLVSILNLIYPVFSSANVETMIFKISKRNNKGIVNCSEINSKDNFFKIKNITMSLKEWDQNEGKFYITSNSSTNTLISRIVKSAETIGDLYEVKTGLQAYEVGKGIPKQTKKDVENHVFDFNSKQDKDIYKYLEGKNIGRYKLVWENKWLKYGIWLSQPRTLDIFTRPRILIREITSPLPYCINGTFISNIYLNNKSILNILQSKDEIDSLLFLLGQINSKLMSIFYKERAIKSSRKLFPKIVIKDLRTFPCIKFKPNNDNNNLVGLVKEMIELNIKLENTRLSDEKNKIKRDIEKDDGEINNLVYKLYNITEEEKKIIEESLK